MNHNDSVYISTTVIECDMFENPNTNLADNFRNTCLKYWERAAFTGFGFTINFSEVYEKATSLAGFLQSQSNLNAGDRVIVQLPNTLQYPIAVYGIIQAGMIVVNTNPLYTQRELLHQAKDSGAKAIICLDTQVALIKDIALETDLSILISTKLYDLAIHSNEVEPLPANAEISSNFLSPRLQRFKLLEILNYFKPDSFYEIPIKGCDVALLQYTGGTTGVSKGAMLTHANLIANANQCNFELLKLKSHKQLTFIAPLPLYHVYAFNLHCLLFFSNGDHSVLVADPRNLTSLISDLSQWKFDGFIGLNTLFSSLLDIETFRALDFSQLKITFSGGMALQKSVATYWKNVTGCGISEGYGLTEASPVVSFNSADDWKPGSIGRLVVGTECRIVDCDGNSLSIGEPGELCIKGPQVMKGYWTQAEATSDVLTPDGWLHTGDIAIMDGSGRLRIVDRKKEMILTSGFNVYPNEIEEVVAEIPEVLYCAAIGEHDEKTGEKIVLYVVLKEGLDISTDAILAYTATKLTSYKRPKSVIFRNSLPMSNVGKILRRELRDASRHMAPAQR